MTVYPPQSLSETVGPANIILNPGFETGTFTGWYANGTGGSTSVQNSIVHSGSYAAKAIITSGGAEYFQQDFTPLLKSQISALTAWTYFLGSGPSIYLHYTDNSNTIVAFPGSFGTWNQIDLLPSLSATKYLMRIEFITGVTNSQAYVDDVVITATYNAQQPSPLIYPPQY